MDADGIVVGSITIPDVVEAIRAADRTGLEQPAGTASPDLKKVPS